MKLSYRGVNYEAESLTQEVTEGEIGGLYRGQPWRVHHPMQQHRRYVAPRQMSYRGIGYRG